MGPSPILSVIHTIIIGTVLNFISGSKEHGVKTLRVNRPQESRFCGFIYQNKSSKLLVNFLLSSPLSHGALRLNQ